MSFERLRNFLTPIIAQIYRIPILGYGARLVVAFVKLPRFNFHLRRIDSEVRLLLETNRAPASWGSAPISGGGLDTKLQELDNSWRHNLPLFLNAISSVGAFGHKLASVERSLADTRFNIDKRLLTMEGHFDSIQNETSQLKKSVQGLVAQIGVQSHQSKTAQSESNASFQVVRDEITKIKQDAGTLVTEAELQPTLDEIVQLKQDIDRLWERIEIMRRELVYQIGSAPLVESSVAQGEKNNVARSKPLK